MNKIKGWLRSKIFKLLKSDIETVVKNSTTITNEEDNLNDDSKYKRDTRFSELVGYMVEIRHYSQEESIFVNVAAIAENATYVMSKDKTGVDCKSRGIVLIDTNKTVYTLSNVYEYEIKRKERCYTNEWN